jgi:ElaB/YqjD/DUF883 family membrane-anchored ribosome-binding protein
MLGKSPKTPKEYLQFVEQLGNYCTSWLSARIEKKNGSGEPQLAWFFRKTFNSINAMKHTKLAVKHSRQLAQDLRGIAIEGGTMIRDAAGSQGDRALGLLRDKLDQAQDFYVSAKKKTIAAAKYTDRTVHEKPYQSIAVALGVGLLVGWLMGGRSRD